MKYRAWKPFLTAGAVAVLLLVSACRSATPVVSPALATSPLSPVATVSPTEVLPSPTHPIIPTPSPGLGVIYGRLVDEAGNPVPDCPIFLGIIWTLQTETGPEDVLVADVAQAPSTRTNEQGYFVFADVEPNTYGIHYGRPADIGAAFARDEDTQNALLFDLAPDSVLDVGEIVRRLPPNAGP